MHWRFLAILLVGSVAEAMPAYQVSQIPVTGGVIIGSQVAINDSGQIVGAILPSSAAFGSDYQPFFSTASTGNIVSLPTNQYAALARINNAGVAVGFVVDDDLESQGVILFDSHGLIYHDGLALSVDLAGMSDVRFSAINNSGQIVGTSDTGGFLLSGGAVTPLAGPVLSLNAINDHGEIVGETNVSYPTPTARAYYTTGSGWTDLGTLGGNNSGAIDINNNSEIVGWAALPDGTNHAALWQNGQIEDLGTLRADDQSIAASINVSGIIVGSSYNFSNDLENAVIWNNNTMPTDLDSLIPPGSGWSLAEATGINDQGDIVGWGYYDNNPTLFVLTPVPEPAVIPLTAAFCLLARWCK